MLSEIPCSSQGSLVHCVCVKLLQASLPMLDFATHKFEKQEDRGWVSCTCSLCKSGAGPRQPYSQAEHFTTGERSGFILPNIITQEQLSLAISNNNFKMFSSVSSLNSNGNLFFFKSTVILLSSSNYLDCIHAMKQNCDKKAITPEISQKFAF